MTRRSLRRFLAGVAAVVAASCSQRPASQKSARELQSNWCKRKGIRVDEFPADSFKHVDSCVLVHTAFTALTKVTHREEISAGDPVQVDRALVVPLSKALPDGPIIQWAYHVTLQLPNRPYDIEVVIDRRGGQPVVSRTHKAMASVHLSE